MASIQKTEKGSRAQIKILGVRDSKLFPTRREASAWAAAREKEIRDGATKPPGDLHTLRDALRRYAEEVSPGRRGERWELLRLKAFEEFPLPLDLPFSKVDSTYIAVLRDCRLG